MRLVWFLIKMDADKEAFVLDFVYLPHPPNIIYSDCLKNCREITLKAFMLFRTFLSFLRTEQGIFANFLTLELFCDLPGIRQMRFVELINNYG